MIERNYVFISLSSLLAFKYAATVCNFKLACVEDESCDEQCC